MLHNLSRCSQSSKHMHSIALGHSTMCIHTALCTYIALKPLLSRSLTMCCADHSELISCSRQLFKANSKRDVVKSFHLSAPVCASKRDVAMASTSSMKMMAGAFSFAILNTSRTMRGPCKAALASISGDVPKAYDQPVSQNQIALPKSTMRQVPGVPHLDTTHAAWLYMLFHSTDRGIHICNCLLWITCYNCCGR